MTAPDMKVIIAATLATHWRASVTIVGLDPWYECQCGHRQLGRGSSHGSTTPWQAAHQASAVLAAISEAGAVEWATEHVAHGSRTIEIHPCDSEADAQGAIAYYGGRILSRITGPWEPVKAVSE